MHKILVYFGVASPSADEQAAADAAAAGLTPRSIVIWGLAQGICAGLTFGILSVLIGGDPFTVWHIVERGWLFGAVMGAVQAGLAFAARRRHRGLRD
jgi:hypothetical protein